VNGNLAVAQHAEEGDAVVGGGGWGGGDDGAVEAVWGEWGRGVFGDEGRGEGEHWEHGEDAFVCHAVEVGPVDGEGIRRLWRSRDWETEFAG